MMEHCTKAGDSKLVERCSYPLTGLACVKRVYTDLAVIDLAALECAIKACIAKKVNQYDFPNKKLADDSYSHNLTKLIGVAGLTNDLTQKERTDQAFSVNWAVAKDWSEQTRYETNIGRAKARDLCNAITDNNNGVLPWLKTFW
jgi:hypothetical protein